MFTIENECELATAPKFALNGSLIAAVFISASRVKECDSKHSEGVYLTLDKIKNMNIGVEEVMLPDC